MESKLSKNRIKGDRKAWLDTDYQILFDKLQEETEELRHEVYYEDNYEAIISECADVANFAMMIADKAKTEIIRRKLEEKDGE